MEGVSNSSSFPQTPPHTHTHLFIYLYYYSELFIDAKRRQKSYGSAVEFIRISQDCDDFPTMQDVAGPCFITSVILFLDVFFVVLFYR